MEYKEIKKLHEMLVNANIPHEVEERISGYHIMYPDYDFVCSVVEGPFTHGGKSDLLEIMGLLTDKESRDDTVAGYLTAEDVFNRISKHWESQSKWRNYGFFL